MSSQGDVEPDESMHASEDATDTRDDAETHEAKPNQIEKPPGIEDFGVAPAFGSLTQLLSTIERRRGDKTFSKQFHIGKFFDTWRQKVGPDLHPVVRLLLPERDNRRRTYSLKEQKLAKALTMALELPPESDAAKKLKDWKVPTKDAPRAGEFSTVAYDVIKSRSTVVTQIGAMNVHEVNKALDDLSRVGYRGRAPAGFSAQEEHSRILRECLGRLTPDEMKWLVRIILRDLKIGMSERVVLGALHVDAIDMFNKCSDILQVCWKLYDKDYRLPREDKQVHIGHPFVPMLCFRSKRDLDNVVKLVTSDRPAVHTTWTEREKDNQFFCDASEFLIEEKLDGERIQLHMKGSEFKYWSRKTKDYTMQYGPNRHSGSLTPFIYDCFSDMIEEIVLDGEMLVWEPSTGKYMPFGQLKSFYTKQTFHEMDPRPCFKVFDVVYAKTPAGAKCLLDVPLFRRKEFLKNILKEKKGVIEFAECSKGKSTTDITDHLKRILEERGEGLVIKNASAIYELASRGHKWIKVKPDYMDQLAESIDARVIGGYWGQGNRGGFHASFLLGVCKSREDAESDNPCFLSFAKVGSGFKFADYEKIKEKQGGKWFDYDRKKLPDWVKIVGEWPDQLIHPSDSFTVTVKAAEITPTRDYATPVTLRFPRAVSQDGKAEPESRTEHTLEDIMAKARDAKDKRAISNDLSDKNKRAKTSRTIKRGFISAHTEVYQVLSNIFKGMTFYVHESKQGGNRTGVSKKELEKMIEQNGGEFIQKIPSPDVDRAVIASSAQGIKNKKGASKGECDILKPDWVLDSVANGRKMPLHKKYFVYATPEAKENPEYDEGSDEEEDEEMVDSSLAPSTARSSQANGYDDSEMIVNDDGTTARTIGAPEPLDPEEERVQRDQDAESDDEVDEPDTEEDDDWQAEPSHRTSTSLKIQGGMDTMGLSEAKPGLGAGLGETHYDNEDLFKHLLFYFDTEENAETNGLSLDYEGGLVASHELGHAKEVLTKHGGRYTNDLLAHDLTHVVMSRSSNGRYKDILHKTSDPRHRQTVTPQWITASVEQDTLLNEAAYRP
ncbi:hypothetical protein ACM66B_000951 [Microbotryomycetes sp. NB124-2]